MQREKLNLFYKDYAHPKALEEIKNMERFVKENEEKFVDQFKSYFNQMLEKISKSEKKVSIINFYVLRTDILQQKYRIWISGYNDFFYMDKQPISICFEIEELFQFLVNFNKYLLSNFRRYVEKVTIDDVDVALQSQVLPHLKCMIHLIRLAVSNQRGNFKIIAGEYRDYFEILYDGLSDGNVAKPHKV